MRKRTEAARWGTTLRGEAKDMHGSALKTERTNSAQALEAALDKGLDEAIALMPVDDELYPLLLRTRAVVLQRLERAPLRLLARA